MVNSPVVSSAVCEASWPGDRLGSSLVAADADSAAELVEAAPPGTSAARSSGGLHPAKMIAAAATSDHRGRRHTSVRRVARSHLFRTTASRPDQLKVRPVRRS
jgi:hypothetical protein